MNHWPQEAETIMEERFGKDSVIALATQGTNGPGVRYVNAYYQDGCFYIITYGLSRKMEQIRQDPRVALCGDWFTGEGIGESLGWFCSQENQELAATLRQVFSQWIDNGHNDFTDRNTIILRVRLTHWLLLSHGRRFEKTAE